MAPFPHPPHDDGMDGECVGTGCRYQHCYRKQGNVYFDYNGIRVNGEPEKDKTYHITFNAGEHASGTSPEATATWNFTKDNDAPTINYQKTAGILVTQLEIKADETEETYRMDVKIDLDATATKSKFDN